MDCCVVVSVSRQAVTFWYQLGGQRYTQLVVKGVSVVPLYFYVHNNAFVFGSYARERFCQNDPDAFGDYFGLVKDPLKHFTLHGSQKRIKQLLYYGIEQFLSHFLTTVLYKNDGIEAYRPVLPLRFLFGPDLDEPERMLVSGLFTEAGYRLVSMISWTDMLVAHMRARGGIGEGKPVLLLSAVEDTLYAALYPQGQPSAAKSIVLPGQGADPRIRILAEMIIDYIAGEDFFLGVDRKAEAAALLPLCAELLIDPPMILQGEVELRDGHKGWYRVSLKKIEETLQHYSGDLSVGAEINDLLNISGVSAGDVVVVLGSAQICTPYFSQRLLKGFASVLNVLPVHTDGAMQLVFQQAAQKAAVPTNGPDPVITTKPNRIGPPPLPVKRPAVPPPLPASPPATPAAKKLPPKLPPPLPPLKKK